MHWNCHPTHLQPSMLSKVFGPGYEWFRRLKYQIREWPVLVSQSVNAPDLADSTQVRNRLLAYCLCLKKLSEEIGHQEVGRFCTWEATKHASQEIHAGIETQSEHHLIVNKFEHDWGWGCSSLYSEVQVEQFWTCLGAPCQGSPAPQPCERQTDRQTHTN